MGTRGLMGFYKNGITKATYNHFDSYPSGLGNDVLEALRGRNIEDLNRVFENLIMVSKYERPTAEQQEQLKIFSDATVSSQSLTEWYVLLRATQGHLELYLGE